VQVKAPRVAHAQRAVQKDKDVAARGVAALGEGHDAPVAQPEQLLALHSPHQLLPPEFHSCKF
jgi:hypothetical protein